jgi:hypothetical protein
MLWRIRFKAAAWRFARRTVDTANRAAEIAARVSIVADRWLDTKLGRSGRRTRNAARAAFGNRRRTSSGKGGGKARPPAAGVGPRPHHEDCSSQKGYASVSPPFGRRHVKMKRRSFGLVSPLAMLARMRASTASRVSSQLPPEEAHAGRGGVLLGDALGPADHRRFHGSIPRIIASGGFSTVRRIARRLLNTGKEQGRGARRGNPSPHRVDRGPCAIGSRAYGGALRNPSPRGPAGNGRRASRARFPRRR